MSTVFSETLCEKELEILVEDDSEEKQSEYQRLTELRPEVRIKYQDIMGCVDIADQYVMSALSPNRKKHWSTAEKLWELTMLLVVNAKKIYESATGTPDIPGPEWKKMVRRTLLGLPTKENTPHPVSLKSEDKKNQKSRCRACSVIFQKDRRTVWRCSICGPICKFCERKDIKGQSNHLRFYRLPSTSRAVRRSYALPTQG